MVKSITLTTVHLLFKNERSTAVYDYSLNCVFFLNLRYIRKTICYSPLKNVDNVESIELT